MNYKQPTLETVGRVDSLTRAFEVGSEPVGRDN
jgi:hypothetical protein